MTDSQEEKIYELMKKFYDSTYELSREASADEDHGGNIHTPGSRQDFIRYFGKFVKRVNSHYQNVCEELNKV